MTERAQRLHELLHHGDRRAVVSPGGTIVTFAELDRQTAALAGWIAARTDPGDRVAVVADNSLAYVQLYYAVPRAGRILALVNQRLSPAEQAAVIAAAEPAIVAGDARYLDALPGSLTTVAFDSPEWNSEALGHPPYVGADPGPGDHAWLVFTSGSTGTPKGVLHTHKSLLAAVRGSVEGRQVPEHGTYLFPFPNLSICTSLKCTDCGPGNLCKSSSGASHGSGAHAQWTRGPGRTLAGGVWSGSCSRSAGPPLTMRSLLPR